MQGGENRFVLCFEPTNIIYLMRKWRNIRLHGLSGVHSLVPPPGGGRRREDLSSPEGAPGRGQGLPGGGARVGGGISAHPALAYHLGCFSYGKSVSSFV